VCGWGLGCGGWERDILFFEPTMMSPSSNETARSVIVLKSPLIALEYVIGIVIASYECDIHGQEHF
jgi:hypothetical protein